MAFSLIFKSAEIDIDPKFEHEKLKIHFFPEEVNLDVK